MRLVAQVWKALFYTMWHSDKRATQADLAERLAGLLHALPLPMRPLWAKVFWQTMMREWGGVDRLRLDKFYMLCRTSFAHLLQELRARGWAQEQLEAYVSMLTEGPLSAKSPAGIRFFFADAILPTLRMELRGPGAGRVPPILIEPFLRLLLAGAHEQTVVKRATEAIVEPLLRPPKGEGDADAAADEDDDEEEEPRLPLRFSWLSDCLFTFASAKETPEKNRTHLYELVSRAEALADGEEALEEDGEEGGESHGDKQRPVGHTAKGAKGALKAQAGQVDALKGLIASGSKESSKKEPSKDSCKKDSSKKESSRKEPFKKDSSKKEPSKKEPSEKESSKKKAAEKKARIEDVEDEAAGREVRTPIANQSAAKKRAAATQASSSSLPEGKRAKKKGQQDAEAKAAPSREEQGKAAPKSETVQPDFTAARRFGGARQGFVFKKGSQGLGYYRDQPAGRVKGASAPKAAQADFTAAKRFEGQRKGFVFKKGPKGLGYYRDQPPAPAFKPGHFRSAGGGGRRGNNQSRKSGGRR